MLHRRYTTDTNRHISWDIQIKKDLEVFTIPPFFYIFRYMITNYYFHNKYTERTFPLKPEDKDKYIVVCVAKGENEYIREWIDHYLNLGFDKIMIGDNNDDFSLGEVLSDYVNDGYVEIFNCHGFQEFQIEFYTMFSSAANYKWAAYFDCDEFLELPGYDSVKEYLERQECACVCFNWLTYSNSGKLVKEKGPVQLRFPEPLMIRTVRSRSSWIVRHPV